MALRALIRAISCQRGNCEYVLPKTSMIISLVMRAVVGYGDCGLNIRRRREKILEKTNELSFLLFKDLKFFGNSLLSTFVAALQFHFVPWAMNSLEWRLIVWMAYKVLLVCFLQKTAGFNFAGLLISEVVLCTHKLFYLNSTLKVKVKSNFSFGEAQIERPMKYNYQRLKLWNTGNRLI